MCCGQQANRLDDAACQWLYNRHRGGESQRVLCAQFRIGTPEFFRALDRGKQLGPYPPTDPALAASPTFPSLV